MSGSARLVGNPHNNLMTVVAELDWLANESRHYTGEWVALDGNRLLAHGPKLAAVKAAAQAAGVSRPFFASVPDDDLPFGGW